MYYPYMCPCHTPHYGYVPMQNYGNPINYWNMDPNMNPISHNKMMFRDYGPQPFVIDINQATKQNNSFRTALWTGSQLQVTLMSLGVGEDIGLEMHPDVDQFLRIEQGQGITQMGKSKDNLTYKRHVGDDSAIFIPAGTWHNLTNTGNMPLKLYSIYAPPNHPFGTTHLTKADAIAAEAEHY